MSKLSNDTDILASRIMELSEPGIVKVQTTVDNNGNPRFTIFVDNLFDGFSPRLTVKDGKINDVPFEIKVVDE